ncbi:ABC-F family ATP-binding cassette domain-containing protein [Paramuribaculum intestinale]|uniref:ABC-F family ATP-binding cassette domain-containing protein n=1 Tax=Paramuribaculum intestinale TaxID=2094151 RepID=UPI0025B42F2D|nr:ABC-F family ATP-binding cassette domain-containing protein [Paramuribaculum intestinale]
MNSFLQIEGLTKSYGDRMLFADVTFGINEGDKIGIVAKNGTGKSTMLRIIAGEEAPDSGTVTARSGLRIGYLPQLPVYSPGTTVLDACLMADTPAAKAVGAYRKALASGDDMLIAEATHRMDEASAWNFEDRLTQLLAQLRINDTSQPMDHLSGGQRKRVALAATLLDEPSMLILDEPTNHLDLDVIEWLEAYLTKSRATLLMVTHDRYFLDRVCNRIIEIDRQELFSYDGNFEYYLRRREERYEAMAAELDRVRNTLRRETEWMRRQPQARAGKAKYRIDAYHDLRKRSMVNLSERKVNLDVDSSYIGSKIFEAEHISKSFGDKVILRDFSYVFARYEKLGIIGRNGAGKSTFIKMLMGLVDQDGGRWNVGETVRFGYYSQEGMEFDPDKRVIDAITDYAEEVSVNDGGARYSPMQWLKRFMFEPSEQQKYIRTLSGGERCRLQLATVLMRSPNFLILDEPTNDLDIMTLGILEEYLAEFKGCLIVISHDRFFLDSIVDHLFVLDGTGEVYDFPGNYTEWRAWEDERQRDTEASSKPTAAEPVREKQRSELERQKLTFKERREFESLEAELEDLNDEKSQLEALFNSGASSEEIASASVRYQAVMQALDEKEMRWLELSEKA